MTSDDAVAQKGNQTGAREQALDESTSPRDKTGGVVSQAVIDELTDHLDDVVDDAEYFKARHLADELDAKPVQIGTALAVLRSESTHFTVERWSADGTSPVTWHIKRRAVTDGGQDWNPDRADLRDDECPDENAHASRNAEQLREFDDTVDTDGWYLYEKDRSAVIGGSYQERGDAIREAAKDDDVVLVVSGERIAELEASDTTLVWETEDAPVVTDGGTLTEIEKITSGTFWKCDRCGATGEERGTVGHVDGCPNAEQAVETDGGQDVEGATNGGDD
ncbi:hypothetical protein [Halovenus marina]|uniref:hypothetical protein n=1 Tax=Halovenus marina TaxID=3396621 RepID=UPI003F546EC6